MSDAEPDLGGRLGGMAFTNGVLVHGPTSWACAIRTAAGTVEVTSGPKPAFARNVRSPVLRGVARIAEALVLVPTAARALPALATPYRDPRLVAALVAGAGLTAVLRRSSLSPAARELAGAALSLAPALALVRASSVAGYHGAEHVTIGSWEHGEPRPRAHERCGSHLVAPITVSTMVGNMLVDRIATTHRGARLGRAGAGVLAVGLSLELFGWALRNPERRAARLLAWPGTALQQCLLTADPSLEQLEVARAALDECVRLERREPISTA